MLKYMHGSHDYQTLPIPDYSTVSITARHDLRAEERKQPLTLDGELFQGTRLLASLSAAL